MPGLRKAHNEGICGQPSYDIRILQTLQKRKSYKIQSRRAER